MNEKSVAIWRCQCDCGNMVELPGNQLLSGNNKSCGCLARPPLKDWVGKQFGSLTVTAYAGKRNGCHYWRCQCSCGKETEVRQASLLSGNTQTCGHKSPLEGCHFVDGTCIEVIASKTIFSNNTSGVRGVYRNNKNGKWVAQITFKRQTRYLGSYEKKEDAAKVRGRAEEELFDGFVQEYCTKAEEIGL